MFKQIITATGAAILFSSASLVAAGNHQHEHSAEPKMEKHEGEHKGQHDMHKAETVSAEVRKVMADKGKVSLKHAEIKSHQMPPMTMVFKVKDTAMLDGLQKGDNVEFSVDEDMLVTAIKKK